MPKNPKGFEIALNIRENILRIQLWGDWDAVLREKCALALQDQIIELSTHARWQIWYVLVDFSRLTAQLDDLAAMIVNPLFTTANLGLKKIAYIGHTTSLSPPHDRDSPPQSCFTSVAEAMQWLHEV